MRYALVISFICLANYANAADTLVTKLINSIYIQVIDSGENQYSLYVYGDIPKTPDEKPINFNFTKAEKAPKDIPFNDFKIAIAKDTTRINWNEYALHGAKVVDADHITSSIFSVKQVTSNPANAFEILPNGNLELIIHVKSGMNKHEIDSLETKAYSLYAKAPGMVDNYYYFSKPIFSKNKKYVLLSVDTRYNGSTYVFKYQKHKWIKVFQFGYYDI